MSVGKPTKATANTHGVDAGKVGGAADYPGKDALAGAFRRETALVLVLVAAIGCFYAWTAATNSAPWRWAGPQRDYYNLLTEGWLEGHLHMKVDVPAELASIADPYDPANRPPGVGLHDASYYRGHYYLYFGAAPVATLLLPFRLVTGHGLPLPVAVAVFSYAGFMASVVALLLLRRRCFPVVGSGVLLLCIPALGLASMAPLLVRRANVWELPLSAGYCFAMLAALGVVASALAGSFRAATAWLAAAALALGLAVASRPTYLFGVGLLAVPLLQQGWSWWRGGRGDWGTFPLRFAVVAAAFGAIVAAVAWHNLARFGDPFEFGANYQFSSIYESRARRFSLDYLPYNLGLYYLRAAEWARYFPFLHAPPAPAAPAGYFGVEEVYGLLPGAPMVVFAILAPWALREVTGPGLRAVSAALGGIAALGLATAMVIACFYAAMARYQADFVPSFVLLACVGLLAGEQRSRRTPIRWRRWMWWGATRSLVAVSVAFVTLWSLALYGDLWRSQPATYQRLAAIANVPVRIVERLAGVEHGPLLLDLRFGIQPPGTREILVTIGPEGSAHHIFVEYAPAGALRFGHHRDGGNTALSDAVEHPAGRLVALRVDLGALHPPPALWLDEAGGPSPSGQRTRLRVDYDGRVLLDQRQRSEAVSPRHVRVGGAGRIAHMGRFSGEILGARRDHSRASGDSGAAGGESSAEQFSAVDMEVEFPRGIVGGREPLIVTGETGRGDLFLVEYLADGRIRFGLDHWGKGLILSAPLATEPGRRMRFRVELGVFAAWNSPGVTAEKTRVRVFCDGREVWNASSRFHPSEPQDVFFGTNPIGGTSCLPRFSGVIRRIQRLPAPGGASAASKSSP